MHHLLHKTRCRSLERPAPVLSPRRGLTLCLFIVMLHTSSWSIERSVGKSLTIPLPEGVRILSKAPHDLYESHELSWTVPPTGIAVGVITEDTRTNDQSEMRKTTEVSEMRPLLEAKMAEYKAYRVRMKEPEGKYSPIEAAPLKRGPWKEALWYTHEEGAPTLVSRDGEEVSLKPGHSLKMVLWDGKKVWSSGFFSRDKAQLAKWLEILEGVEFNTEPAQSSGNP